MPSAWRVGFAGLFLALLAATAIAPGGGQLGSAVGPQAGIVEPRASAPDPTGVFTHPAGPAGSPEPGWDFDPVRTYVRRVMEERRLPSVSIAVAVDGEIVWEEAFGWADVNAHRRATPSTPYSLASISKPMTATAVLLLREQGRLDLDSPLDRYMEGGSLQGLAGPAQEATVRRVLSHTAGLPLHYTFFYRNEDERPPTPAETLRRYGILVFPPGERFEYSNLGYGLLGFLIRNVSGEAYGSFMEAEVFEPLGLTRTFVGIPPEMKGEWARRYGPGGQELPFYEFDHPGASAIFSSAHDLVRFGAFHLGHAPESGSEGGEGAHGAALLPASARGEMQIPQEPPSGNGYGLGWFVEDEFGFRKVYHTGSMPGVSTMLALYPEEDVAIVVLLNALDREQRVEIAREVASVVIPGYRNAWEARVEPPHPPSEPEAEDPAERLAGRWAGSLKTWKGEIPVVLSVDPDGRGTMTLGDGGPLEIRSLRVRDDVLSGQIHGQILTPDARVHPRQILLLKLVLRKEGKGPGTDDVLEGQATAQTTDYPSHFALSSYLKLVREPPPFPEPRGLPPSARPDRR